ncbi:polyprenyl synthetase family protein [Kitasatospora sp. NPDC101157]|uniref:polyprenyl synthetase family protein n=1 Tax=Kitasatospora sp. NPDC101157 TaxID=3364098 RepID=UPI0037FEAD89
MSRPLAGPRPDEVPAEDLRLLTGRVESALGDLLADQLARWSEVDRRAAVPVQAVADLVAAGGKRLRPVFCLAGFLAGGGRPEDGEYAVRAATALELLHASALIHDDVMDEADERRGLPTVRTQHSSIHRAMRWQGDPDRYGESVAILAGDLAWVYADHLMADLPAAVRQEWYDLRTELVAGQMLDVSAATELRPDVQLASKVAVLKSGRYTVLRPLRLGAALAGRADLHRPFQVYGEALGEAFQLRDDLIDVFGDRSLSGKPGQQDLRRPKMTLLLSIAVQQDERIRDLARVGQVEALVARLESSGARDLVEARIDRLLAEAHAAVATANLTSPWREHLAALATVIARPREELSTPS